MLCIPLLLFMSNICVLFGCALSLYTLSLRIVWRMFEGPGSYGLFSWDPL